MRDIKRFLPSAEVLTLGATLMAAIAAAFSAWSAFLQRRATFTSILYGKQIEEVAQFLDVAGKARDDIMLDSAAILNNKDAQLRDLRHAFDKLSPLEDSMMEDLAALELTVPHGYAVAGNTIAGNVITVLFEWRTVLDDAATNKAGDLVKVIDQPGLTKLLIDNHQTSYRLQLLTDIFRQCTYMQLKGGRVLSEADSNQCIPRY